MLLLTIGQRLRTRRRQRGLTQAELALAAGVSARFLVQLEGGHGNISVQRLFDICSVLAMPLDELFAGVGPLAESASASCVALVGLRGAGKSAVGALLAQRAGGELVELDEQVERAAGMSLAEVFELSGEERYRQLETQTLDQVLTSLAAAERDGGAGTGPAAFTVLATGGSLVTRPLTWQRLRGAARTVWLRASPESHLARVRAQGDLRPMLGRADALGELREILRERTPLYAQADLHIDTDQLSIEAVVERIMGAMPGGLAMVGVQPSAR